HRRTDHRRERGRNRHDTEVVSDVAACGRLPRVRDGAKLDEVAGDDESGLAAERAVADAHADDDARRVVVRARTVRGGGAFGQKAVTRGAEITRRATGPDKVGRAAERPRAG